MFRLLVKKYVNESMLLWSSCMLMLCMFCWVRIWTVAQFELSGFAPLIEQVRAFENFSPIPLEKFLTYEGVIGLTYDEPILILCVLVWSISRGSDLVSGEVGRGTMEMLLAQPVSRLQVVTAHALVSIIGLALLVASAHLGIHLGIETNSTVVTQQAEVRLPMLPFGISNPFSEPTKTYEPLSNLVTSNLYIPASLNLFGLGFAILSLSVCMSSFDQYRWRTIGVVIGVYILQLLLFILGKSATMMSWVINFSLLSAYQPDWIIQRTNENWNSGWHLLVPGETQTDIGPLGLTSILISVGLVLYGAGVYKFCKRDLPAPL